MVFASVRGSPDSEGEAGGQVLLSVCLWGGSGAVQPSRTAAGLAREQQNQAGSLQP